MFSTNVRFKGVSVSPFEWGNGWFDFVSGGKANLHESFEMGSEGATGTAVDSAALAVLTPLFSALESYADSNTISRIVKNPTNDSFGAATPIAFNVPNAPWHWTLINDFDQTNIDARVAAIFTNDYYFYFWFPSALTYDPTKWNINGQNATGVKVKTFDFTNASGTETSYNLWTLDTGQSNATTLSNVKIFKS